jgi:thiol-disulfide isomerase/thioredoxin
MDSNLVSLADVQYRNRVCIIQIMGTWCPNCMDETVFLDSIYRARREEGLEIIGLAFERNSDFASATARIKKTVQHLHVSYPVLLGGVARKGEVEKVVPALKGFFSYPTTLILDRRKNIVKVHTGFSGPATGASWEEYRQEFNKTLDRLLR